MIGVCHQQQRPGNFTAANHRQPSPHRQRNLPPYPSFRFAKQAHRFPYTSSSSGQSGCASRSTRVTPARRNNGRKSGTAGPRFLAACRCQCGGGQRTAAERRVVCYSTVHILCTKDRCWRPGSRHRGGGAEYDVTGHVLVQLPTEWRSRGRGLRVGMNESVTTRRVAGLRGQSRRATISRHSSISPLARGVACQQVAAVTSAHRPPRRRSVHFATIYTCLAAAAACKQGASFSAGRLVLQPHVAIR